MDPEIPIMSWYYPTAYGVVLPQECSSDEGRGQEARAFLARAKDWYYPTAYGVVLPQGKGQASSGHTEPGIDA